MPDVLIMAEDGHYSRPRPLLIPRVCNRSNIKNTYIETFINQFQQRIQCMYVMMFFFNLLLWIYSMKIWLRIIIFVFFHKM